MVWPYHSIESRSKLNIIRDSQPTLNFHRDRKWFAGIENVSSRFHKNLFDSHSKILPFIRHVHARIYIYIFMCVCVSIYTFIFIYSFERVFNSGHWIEVFPSPTVYINIPPYEFSIEKIRTVTRRKIVTSFCLLPIFYHRWRIQVFVEFYFIFFFFLW